MIFTPTQADFDAFARLSGDANPIHIDPVFSDASGFGRPVAHGAMLTGWLLRAGESSGSTDSVKTSATMFPAPAFADEPLEAVHTDQVWMLKRVHDGTCVCQLQINAPSSGHASVLEPTTILEPDTPLKIGMHASLHREIAISDWQEMSALLSASGATLGHLFPLAALSTLLGMNLPGQGTNYLKQAMDWHKPLKAGDTMKASVTLTRLRPDQRIVDLATSVTVGSDLVATGRALVSARDVHLAFQSPTKV